MVLVLPRLRSRGLGMMPMLAGNSKQHRAPHKDHQYAGRLTDPLVTHPPPERTECDPHRQHGRQGAGTKCKHDSPAFRPRATGQRQHQHRVDHATGQPAPYQAQQQRLPGIKPALADLTYALPSLAKQKAEMVRQTLELLDAPRDVDGYVEIGSTGRYMGALRRRLRLTGDLVLINDLAPGYSPVDIVERGRLTKLGRFVPLADYAPIAEADVANASVDLVSCYIGLHHVDPAALDAFLASIHRILRPGGRFILRDHDVTTPAMSAFVSLAHTVFNAGLGVAWETNRAEPRHFAPVAAWVAHLARAGLHDTGLRRLQAQDPTDNVLMAFVKEEA